MSDEEAVFVYEGVIENAYVQERQKQKKQQHVSEKERNRGPSDCSPCSAHFVNKSLTESHHHRTSADHILFGCRTIFSTVMTLT